MSGSEAESLGVQKLVGTKEEDHLSETGSGEKKTAIDPYKYLKLTKNPDGSLTRHPILPLAPPRPVSEVSDELPGEETKTTKSVSKDVTLNKERKTWMRIHRPDVPPVAAKLPLIINFHGGGFIYFSADTAPFDAYCSLVATELQAVVVAVDYRLAPENRLPAAYEDAAEALEWLRDHLGDEEWLRDYADAGRCFLDGSSAGGNIAFHLGLKVQQLELGQVVVQGLILNEPYFGGSSRTESELRRVDDPILPLSVNDLMWELALPVGSDRDHEYCNPMGSVREEDRDRLGLLPRCLVRGHEGDPLVDRQKEFAKMLERFGVSVVTRFGEGGFHAVELVDPVKNQELLEDVRDFVLGAPPSML